MGTDTGWLKWREDGEKEIMWIVDPSHPIAEGLPEKIVLPNEEMYGEHFLFRSLTSRYLSAGLKAEKYSGPVAAGTEVWEK